MIDWEEQTFFECPVYNLLIFLLTYFFLKSKLEELRGHKVVIVLWQKL